MEFERNSIDDDFKILAVMQIFMEPIPKFKSFRFHWDPIDGLGDCVLSADPWEWQGAD